MKVTIAKSPADCKPCLNLNTVVSEGTIQWLYRIVIAQPKNYSFTCFTVTDKWQLVAEKFGLNRDRIDFLNSRCTNPADALLAHMALQRPLTVGYVYDLLCECDLQVIADKL